MSFDDYLIKIILSVSCIQRLRTDEVCNPRFIVRKEKLHTLGDLSSLYPG